MHLRKIFLVIMFGLFCSKIFANVYTVTTNADSGPGSLRQALFDATADGTTVIDSIYFNIPGLTQSARTITLQSALPDVTANVIIDGTTQPGTPFGVSSARVVITTNAPAPNFNGFTISDQVQLTDQVAIYGMYIEGFSPGDGIYSGASCALTVGAPGKGNVIVGNNYAFDGHFQGAAIQSNFIGIQPDGVSPFLNLSVLYSGGDYDKLTFGGGQVQDGNVVISGTTSGINLGGLNSPGTRIAVIQNNLFNTDYTGTQALGTASNSCILVNDPNTFLAVIGNVFSAKEIAVSGVNKSAMQVTGNFFGTDRTQTHTLGTGTWAIENNDVNSVIGGTAPADQNVFTNYQNPVNAYNNSYTKVVQNMFYCNSTVQLYDPTGGKNFIRITSLTATGVGGDAPPNATVQLYYTATKCGSCNPNTCFATVTANALGKWQYSGTITGNVLASSTVSNNTVGFLVDSLSQSEVTITNYDCHHGGSIVFNEVRSGNLQFTWFDSKNNVIAHTPNIVNIAPGTYTVQESENGSCPSVSNKFTIIDLTPKVYSQTFNLDCATPTGNFTAYPTTGPGITVANYYWTDSTGTVIGTNQSISGLAAGKYYLYIRDSNGCTSAKALCQVMPPIAAPVIDDSKVTVTDADCTYSDGSISGISVSNLGGANYGWSTTAGKQLDYGQLNLTHAPAGDYYFFVYYHANCPPVVSKTFTIGVKNALTVDTSAVAITPATCANSDGAIKGITAVGATAYQWIDSNNKTAGTSADLTGVPAGTYYLVVTNAGCTIKTAAFTVGDIPPQNEYPSTSALQNATCGLNNGGVTVTFSPPNQPASYRWTDAAGNTLFTNAPLTGAAAGSYNLYVTDSNGCESLYSTFTVKATPALQIVAGSEQITADQCSLGTGGIQNVSVTGGVPPYTYAWTDAAQKIIATTQNLSSAASGTYTLTVKDATGCGVASQQYTIPLAIAQIPEPAADSIETCAPGQVLIMVNNPQNGYGYRLYSSAAATVPLDDETSGIFKLNVQHSESLFISQYSGTCESARYEVKIAIGLSSIVVPSAFTPNGDGVNDLWQIKGIERYPYALVQVFNRYGQKVFESNGYTQPFDGTERGTQLPPGVYYYIINLKANCSLLSGSLTLVR